MDSKSGPSQKPCKRPLTLEVIALEPHGDKTPWWARRAGLTYSHIVARLGEYIWDQPIKGEGQAYHAQEWLDSACAHERGFLTVTLELEDHDPAAWLASCRMIEGRKGQKIRTMLRHLRLWPTRPWNCTSPVRFLLLGAGCPVNGETPDAIIEELTA